MSHLEIFQIFLSFCCGGLVVTAITWIVPKLGSEVGGIIGSLPTVLSISLLFQGIVVSPTHAASATPAALIALSLFGVFCAVFYFMARRGLWIALMSANLAWLCTAAPVVLFHVTNFGLAVVVFAVISALCYAIFFRFPTFPAPENSAYVKTQWKYTLRFLFSGSIIALSVFLSLVLNETWGGIIASYPASALSGIIILYHAQGHAFTTAYVRKLFSSAVFNCGVYIAAVYYLYPVGGLLIGTIGAYILAAISAAVLYRLHKRRTLIGLLP